MSAARNILLTGGAGFIGSHLAQALLAQGHRVCIVDDLNDFYAPQWKQRNLADIQSTGDAEFVQANVNDQDAMRLAFGLSRPDTVIHLAAYAGVRPSIARPCSYEQANVGGTVCILELCREFGVEKFLFGSSSSIYGATSRVPFSEDQVEMKPISPYAATKLAGEMMAYTYAHLFGLQAVCLRFFTVYGPRQRPDLAIHKFTALMEAGLPIPMFGDGSAGRDYTYVADIVDGITRAMQYEPPLVGNARFEVFNLGNSRPVALAQLILQLQEVTGKIAILERVPDQPGDVPITWADISKAQRLLGYNPGTSLEAGLAKFVEWYRAAPAEQKYVAIPAIALAAA